MTNQTYYSAKMKWDGVRTTLRRGFTDMEDANDWINDQIALGNLRPVENEFREYYIMPEPEFQPCDRCHINHADAFTETLTDEGWQKHYTGRCTQCEDIVQHSDDINFNRDLGV
jgi:hypothetical protein